MDEKVFDLLEKMYVEVQGIKSKMATKDDINRFEDNMVGMESEMKNDIKALRDGYKQSVEGITEIREKLDKSTEKVENKEIKLQVIKSVK